jgi:hypothetical protein
MFLALYDHREITPTMIARISARHIERTIAQLKCSYPGTTFVTTRERDLSPSQQAVLACIADHQEAEFLAALQSGELQG